MHTFRGIIYACAVACSTTAVAVAEPVGYARDVKPILSSRCYSCHGGLKQEASLRLDTGKLARKGGDDGPAVEPGNADESILIERVLETDADLRMPPEGEPLSAEQIAVLKAWIAQGAKSPADEQPQSDPRQHWSFQTPTRPQLPQVKNTTWVRNPIDAFIAADHEQRDLTPQSTATKPEILRRVSIDLIGLPPTREQLHAFLADTSEDAYDKVVEELLASPQYGERWGRHWMDVWRYSDWYGRRQVNDVRNSYGQIWRWRDWIVDSLNDDKGYDRMVLEMLAADEIAPEDDKAIVATGFLVRNWYSLNYNAWMKDIVEHTSKAFLAMRMNCAHCHDHKYDPVSQEEYFRFRAVFEPLEIRRDRVAGEPDPGPFQSYVYASSTKPIQSGLVRVIDKTLDAKTYMYHLGDSRNRMKDKPPTPPGAPAILGGEHMRVEPVVLPAVAHYPGLKNFIQQETLSNSEKAFQQAKQQLAAAKGSATGKTALLSLQVAEIRLTASEAQLLAVKARIAADQVTHQGYAGDSKQASQTAARAGRFAAIISAQEQSLQAQLAITTAKDDAARKKAKTQQTAAEKVLAAAQKTATEAQDAKYSPLSPTYPTESTGRRRALAQWIASKKNPRTARVAVNHIWLRHFGAALVPSIMDFGVSGDLPTHPKLLDWLAVEFTEGGWQMKRLHRLIVTSNTYRMSSRIAATNSGNIQRDPDNARLWRFPSRRMESEVIRDSLLHLAGELDLTRGGREIESKDAAKSKRRSIYFSTHPEAGGTMVFLDQFDAPDPGDCYRRTDSIVPQQALAMTNSELSLDQSRLLARKLSDRMSDKEGVAFVTAAYEHLLTRLPSSKERTLCDDFLHRQRKLYQAETTQTASKQADKENSNTTDSAADFNQRARASLIRVLFSHNDFVTVP